MRVEYLIARRTAERNSGGRPSIMVRVATISVALSVALIIITLAIVLGFKGEITNSITGFTSHAIVGDVSTFNGSQSAPISRSRELEELLSSEKGLRSASAYATTQGVIRSDEAIEGVMLRGIDSLYDSQFLERIITQGALPRTSEQSTTRDVLLSQSLSQRLGIGVGDRLELIVSDVGESMRRDLFKVCGLYATGLDEWDRMILITDMRNVQRLNGWRADQISGYELRYSSLSSATAGCDSINERLLVADIAGGESIFAITTESLYPSIFDWLKAHDVNALIIIVIMIIVAGFNMATALLIMVLERTRMIGTLKSLGMSNVQLQRIFLYRALEILLWGLLWGNVISIGLALLQHQYHLLRLDAASYILNFVPVELGAWWIVLINIVVVVTILALMVIPARLVSQVKIEDTLKFE